MAVPFDYVGNIVLIIQVISLFLLIAGVIPVRHRSGNRIIRHGYLAALALGLNIITLFAVMVPSLSTNFSAIEELSILQWLVVWLHAISGGASKIMGAALVGLWAFKPEEKMACAKRKWLMMPTLIIWTFATILGAIIHGFGII